MHADPDRASRHFAERTLRALDDVGRREEVCIWIDWLEGGIWGVGRAVDRAERENPGLVRDDDWIFRGYEMQDALEAANTALSADVEVAGSADAAGSPALFSEAELRPRLERWFFDQ